MTANEILSLTALQLGERIKAGEVTSEEATRAYLEQMKALEPDIHAYTLCEEEKALEVAQEIDKRIAAGELTGPLAGVPVAVKDNMCIEGSRTACSSHILDNFVPTYTATAVEKLMAAGAVVIGRTNMDEFAMGSTTETSYFGPTYNPWDTTRVPGGSSGGSAAAVAADECAVALGSDTGGSIRQPASFCGVTGIKPTYGRVSRYGLIAYGSSLDQIGPIGKDVADCAAVLEIIAGHDSHDSTSAYDAAHAPGRTDEASSDKTEEASAGSVLGAIADEAYDTHFTEALVNDVSGMRIGVPRDYFLEGIDEDVKKAVLGAAETLKKRGAIVEEFDLGMVEYAIPAYYIIACAEASSNLERFDGVKYGYRTKDYTDLHNMYKKTRSEGFGAEVKRRIMLGSFVLSSGYYDAYYVKALRVKALIKKAFDEAFAKYDVILGPVAPTTALKCGESLSDPIKMYLGDIYTVAVNLAGIPGISLPCGYDSEGLPIGLQLLGQTFDEKKIIRAAYTFEQEFADQRRTPAIREEA